jgi:hypothetical protein
MRYLEDDWLDFTGAKELICQYPFNLSPWRLSKTEASIEVSLILKKDT